MSEYIDRFGTLVGKFIDRNPSAVRVTLTAAAAAALTASTILGFQAIKRQSKARDLKNDLLTINLPQTKLNAFGIVDNGSEANMHIHDQSLIDEQLARNIAFLGHDKVKQLQRAHVVVVGAGSVGSWAALMLLRSGIQHMRIIDPNPITLASLSHHAVAESADVGVAKALVLKKHFKDIAPFARLDCRVEKLTRENIYILLAGNPDFVVDTLERVEDKVELIKYCNEKGIKVISAMSAGGKADPTRISILDISDTMEDPMSRAVRRRLRHLGVDRGVPVVFSTEKPLYIPGSKEKIESFPDFPTRVLPSLGTITSQYGMAIATYIILRLSDFSAYEDPVPRLRDGVYNRILRDLETRESMKFNNKSTSLTVQDVGYIFEEIWYGKSVLSGPQDRLALVRWDTSKPLGYLNTVCMSKNEAREHEDLPLGVDLVKQYGKDVVDFVNKRIEQEKRFQTLFNAQQ
ncbi:hypothetical protein CLU79DRAFT_839425 [Phycomyces nitens]|nr:hypothetical protein CLU79DRAFT_839425 [Phycomyces nitens]